MGTVPGFPGSLNEREPLGNGSWGRSRRFRAEPKLSRTRILQRDAETYRSAARYPSFRGTSGRSDTGWVSSPSKPGSETLGNGTHATAGRGGRLRHARGYAPPRIHRRGWLARHASRFSGVGARPRTPDPERGRWTTTRVQPGATTRPRRRSLRSRPRGCRRPRALRWQPSARVQGLEPRGANGARRESAVPEPCLRRRRAVVAARAIHRPVRRGAGWTRCRTAAP